MRFYFIVLITSSTFIASCDGVNGSKLTTVPNAAPMNPADANHTTVAAEKMRQTVNRTVDEIVEERADPSSSAVAAVHAIESKWKKMPASFPKSEEQTNLVKQLSNELNKDHSTQSIRTLFYEHRQFHDHASLIHALGQLIRIHRSAISSQFLHLYLEMLVDQGYTPLQMLSELNKEWVPSKSVLRNLKTYIEMYNEKFRTQISMLTTLKEYVGNDYDLALIISHFKRHGGIVEHDLNLELATYYAQHYRRPDDVFELLRPKNGESEWNFQMLHDVFRAYGQSVDDLVQFLERKFGGIHILAPILAEADELDAISRKLQKTLQKRLVRISLYDFGLNLYEVVEKLKLREAALTRNNLETFRLYIKLKNRLDSTTIDWRKCLADILGIDERWIPILSDETTNARR